MNVFSDEPYSETDLARDAEADIALPDSSLGSLPEGDSELPIANLFVGLGDRSRAEKTLSNPIENTLSSAKSAAAHLLTIQAIKKPC